MLARMANDEPLTTFLDETLDEVLEQLETITEHLTPAVLRAGTLLRFVTWDEEAGEEQATAARELHLHLVALRQLVGTALGD